MPTVSRPERELSRNCKGNVGRVETLLLGKDGCESQLEKAVREKVTPENSFFHICGYPGTIDAVVSILNPLGLSPTARSATTDHLTSKLKHTIDDSTTLIILMLPTSNSCHITQRELRAIKAQ